MSQSTTFLRSALVLEEIGVGPIWLRRSLGADVAGETAELEVVPATAQHVAQVVVCTAVAA